MSPKNTKYDMSQLLYVIYTLNYAQHAFAHLFSCKNIFIEKSYARYFFQKISNNLENSVDIFYGTKGPELN